MFLLRIFIILSLAGSLLTVPPSIHWLLEINARFCFYYFCADLISLILLWVIGETNRQYLCPNGAGPLAYCLLCLLAFYGLLALPVFDPSVSTKLEVPYYVTNRFKTVRMLVVDVQANEASQFKLAPIIARLSPEILILLAEKEIPEDLLPSPKQFAFQQRSFRRNQPELRVYSKFHLLETPTLSLGDYVSPVILTTVDITPDRSLDLNVFRLPPVLGNEDHQANWLLLRRLSTRLRFDTKDSLVAANVGTTPFSGVFRNFIGGAYLGNLLGTTRRDQQFNFAGLNALTNSDQVLYKGDVAAKEFQAVHIQGLARPGLFLEIGVGKGYKE